MLSKVLKVIVKKYLKGVQQMNTTYEQNKAAYIAKGMDEFRYLEHMSRAQRLIQAAIYGTLKKTVDHNPDIDNDKLKELVLNELETMFAANDTKVLKETAEHDTDSVYNSYGTDELIFYKDNEITVDNITVDDEKIVVEYMHDFAEGYEKYSHSVILKR